MVLAKKSNNCVFIVIHFAARANVCPEYSALLKAITTPLTSNNKNKATLTRFQHSLDTSALLQSSQGQILFLLHTMGTLSQDFLNDTSVKVDFRIYPFSSDTRCTSRNGDESVQMSIFSMKIVKRPKVMNTVEY